jgi:hypothetical protein
MSDARWNDPREYGERNRGDGRRDSPWRIGSRVVHPSRCQQQAALSSHRPRGARRPRQAHARSTSGRALSVAGRRNERPAK